MRQRWVAVVNGVPEQEIPLRTGDAIEVEEDFVNGVVRIRKITRPGTVRRAWRRVWLWLAGLR